MTFYDQLTMVISKKMEFERLQKKE